MTNLQILQLMWLGMQYATFSSSSALPYADLELTLAEADDWMHSIQHEGLYLATMVDNDGFYQPCLRSY